MVHIDHVDEVEGEQPEKEATDPAGELEELQGHGVVVLVHHLHLGPVQGQLMMVWKEK